MKQTYLLTLLVTLLALTSCSTYQYVTLEDAPATNENSSSSIKDSVKVAFTFTGDGGNIVMHIRNNSEHPIIVDKTKSNLIKGEKTIPLWEDKSVITASSTTRQSSVDKRNYYTDTDGQIIKDETLLFIPPASKGELNGPKIQTNFLDSTPNAEIKKILIPTPNGSFKGEQIHFGNNSPHQFRVFLTFSKYGSDEKPFFMDKTFNAKTLTNTSVKPNNFNKSGDKHFYIKETTGFGTFMGGVAGLGLLIIAAVAQ
ncbi:hypothetical protein [Marinilabilia rubra]|uniref:Lipoprotein n=1 Tax=Marinilabilia rubra TaxID=2162893 RepID=A0A2U2BCY9_9BACT|nr:hypothetical protein [Marinilabilia rubra]PWE00934.1 hypothetical protein DDZ16_00120 [Marinilabilia rubra]